MQSKKFVPQDDYHLRNLDQLRAIVEELAIWRYRVQSALLVASSALLALSFSMLPPETHTPRIGGDWLYLLLLSSNVLQILASIAVLGITLKNYIGFADNAQRVLPNPVEYCQAYIYTYDKNLHRLLSVAEVASFAFFVATVLILAVCRILALA